MAGYIGTQAVSVNTTSATISDDLSVGDDALITGTLTTTAATVFNGGFAANAASTITTTGNGGLEVISTDQDALVGPNLDLFRNIGQAGTDGDLIGQLNFYGLNDASEKTHYLYLNAKMNDVANGSEDVRWALNGIMAGEDVSFIEFTAGTPATGVDPELVINNASKDINFRVESNNLAAALFVDGANGRVGINNAAPPDLLSVTSGHINLTAANSYIKGSGHNVLQVDNTYTYFYGGSDGVQTRNAANDATLMNITDAGIITMPLQPAFLGHSTSNQTNVAINTRVDVIVAEVFDQNADFTSNTFTAPVAGRYQLNFSLRLEAIDSAATFVQTRITTSNRNYEFIFDPDFGQDNAYYSVAGGVVADMDASDTAKITIFQGGGTAQMDINGASFSGSLAC